MTPNPNEFDADGISKQIRDEEYHKRDYESALFGRVAGELRRAYAQGKREGMERAAEIGLQYWDNEKFITEKGKVIRFQIGGEIAAKIREEAKGEKS